jgi:hypothetical protein
MQTLRALPTDLSPQRGWGRRFLLRLYHSPVVRLLRRLNASARKRVTRLLWPLPDHKLLISRPCSILGRSSPRLTASQRAIIRTIIDTQRHLWMTGEIPPPPEMNVYATSAAAVPKSVAVVMPRYINCTPTNMDHDIAYHVAHSAESAGMHVSRYDADDITYQGKGKLRTEIGRLQEFLWENRPEIVAFDGNYMPNGRTIDADVILELKRAIGFKLLVIIPDCYDGCPVDYLGYWHRIADASVIFHRDSRYLRNLTDRTNVMVCPTLPIDAATFAVRRDRDIDIGYSGGNTRERGMFLDAAADAGLRTKCWFHNRTRRQCPSIQEFADLLGRSKMAFNNGWVSNGESIITARVGEVIVAGAVLLQEVGSPIDDYLVPFVHYVPVANITQFVAFCQFLAEDDERCSALASGASEFWRAHYGSDSFWRYVAQKCR